MNHIKNNRLDSYRIVAFAAPSFATALIYGPMAGILPALIVKHFGVEMAAMSSLLLLTRFFDGMTDPVVGVLSDRTHTAIGRRKPWIIAGFVVMMIAVYRIFMPPSSAGAVYFLIWLTIIALGWTMTEVPYAAWISEITRDYIERTRIQTFRQSASLTGAILFAVAPLLPIFASNEMTPEVLEFLGKVILFVIPPAVCASLMLNREGKRVAVREALSIKDLAASLKANRPFRLFIAFNVCFGFAVGMLWTLSFPALDAYLMIGDKVSYIMISSTLAAFCSLPIWLKIISRIGKHRALTVSGFLAIVITFTFPLITPGPGSFIPYMLMIIGVQICFGAYLVAPLPILADIIDYDILKTGTNRAAQYSAMLTLLIKCNQAVSGAFAYFLLSQFGFDIASTTHSPEALAGFRATYVYIPMSFAIIGTILTWFFPIDERKQKIIRTRIEKRAERRARIQPNIQ